MQDTQAAMGYRLREVRRRGALSLSTKSLKAIGRAPQDGELSRGEAMLSELWL